MLQVSEPSYDRVLDCCKEAIDRVPENVKAHYRCGVALFHLCRYDDAVASLQKAAQLQDKTGAFLAVNKKHHKLMCFIRNYTLLDKNCV